MGLSVWDISVGMKVVWNGTSIDYPGIMCDDPCFYLSVDAVYTISIMSVHEYACEVCLEEVPGKVFNCTVFEEF